MKIVIFSNDKMPLAWLYMWATGGTDYHCAFTDGVHIWDQNILFRRRDWNPSKPDEVMLYECPVPIEVDALNEAVIRDTTAFCHDRAMANVYGWRDYIGFALRKLGGKPRNFGGVVCSGRLRDVLFAHGAVGLGTPIDLEPSPADIRLWLQRQFIRGEIYARQSAPNPITTGAEIA